MIPLIESGVQGLDELCGGLPENSATLVYGPPKVGKSVFCYEFALHGLGLGEPCLYLATDYGVIDLVNALIKVDENVEKDISPQNFFLIDAASDSPVSDFNEYLTYNFSSLNNPTDLMVKLGLGTDFIQKQNPRFRGVLDSLTTLLSYNDDMLIVRVLKAYIMRIKESGGTAIISYTEGSAPPRIETFLKSMADNLIHMDGENIHLEAMLGQGKVNNGYSLESSKILLKGVE